VTRHRYSLAAVGLAAGGLLALASCGTDTARRDAGATVPGVSAADRAWLAETHRAGLANVQYGRLAQRKGATAAVREAGGALAADHDRLDRKVASLAGRLHVGLPESAGTVRLAAARRLDGESGSRFDRDFTTTLAGEHREAIAHAEQEVRRGSSPEVIALARAALPELRRHLAMLRRADPVG
jgi:putative membrane protein